MSSRANISTAHRLDYARGYLALDLVNEAVEELSFLSPEERNTDAVLEIMMDVHGLRKDWKAGVLAAQEYVCRHPEDPKGWISWAYATRRLESICAAEKILLEADKLIGEPALSFTTTSLVTGVSLAIAPAPCSALRGPARWRPTGK